jgi:hypothetical protein
MPGPHGTTQFVKLNATCPKIIYPCVFHSTANSTPETSASANSMPPRVGSYPSTSACMDCTDRKILLTLLWGAMHLSVLKMVGRLTLLWSEMEDGR